MQRTTHRILVIAITVLAIHLAAAAIHLVGAAAASAATCSIACENAKPGTPQSTWDVNGAGSAGIQGFATDISVNVDQTQSFKVKTNARSYRLDIYRMGYYGGNGARKVATVTPSAALPQTQPACRKDTSTNLTDCGNWAVSATWAVPADAVSGIYFAKLVRTDGTSGSSHIFFVVREDASHSAPALPDLGHDLAGLQRLRRQQLLRRPAADRARLQAELQPPVQHALRPCRGLRLQLRVSRRPLARAQRLRRLVHDGLGLRPARRPDQKPQDLPLRRPRRVLVGRAAGQRRGRPRRRA